MPHPLPLLAQYLLAIVQRLVGPREPRLWTTQPQRWPRCKQCGDPLDRRRGAQLCGACRQRLTAIVDAHRQRTEAQAFQPAIHACRQCGESISGFSDRCRRCMSELAQPRICLACQALIEVGDYCEPCRLKRLFGVPPAQICPRCRSRPVDEAGAICESCRARIGAPLTVSLDPAFGESWTGFAVISLAWQPADDLGKLGEPARDDSEVDDSEVDDSEAGGDYAHIEQQLRDIYWTKERP